MTPKEFSELLLFMIHTRTQDEIYALIQLRTPHWSMQHLVAAVRQHNDVLFEQIICEKNISVDVSLSNEIIFSKNTSCLEAWLRHVTLLPHEAITLLHQILWHDLDEAWSFSKQQLLFQLTGKADVSIKTVAVKTLSPQEQATALGIDEKYILKIDNETVGFAKDNTGKWYPATILEEKGAHIHIHYQGWDDVWDELIEHDSDRFTSLDKKNIGYFRRFCIANPSIPAELQIVGYLLQSHSHDPAFALLQTLRECGLVCQNILKQHLPALVALGADIRFCYMLSEWMVPEEKLHELPFEIELIDSIMTAAVNNGHDTFLDEFVQVCPGAVSLKWIELALAMDKPRCLRKLVDAFSHSNVMVKSPGIMELVIRCVSKGYADIALRLWTILLNEHPDPAKTEDCLLKLIKSGANRCFLDVFTIYHPHIAEEIFDYILLSGAEDILPSRQKVFQWGWETTLPEVLLLSAARRGRWKFITGYLNKNFFTDDGYIEYLTLALQNTISDGHLSVRMAENAICALVTSMSSPHSVLKTIKRLQEPFRILERREAPHRHTFGLFHPYVWQGSLTSRTWHNLVRKAKQTILRQLGVYRQKKENRWDNMEDIETFLAEPTGRVSALIGKKTGSLKAYQKLSSG